MTRYSASTAFALLALILTPAFASAEVRVDDAWARATPPGVSRGAGYMMIHNEEERAVRLTGASLEPAKRVEIHESRDEDGQMEMQAVADGIAIPAGESVALEPMGYHLMIMGLETPLKAGDEHELTLEFSDGDTVTTSLEVRSPNHDNGASGHNH